MIIDKVYIINLEHRTDRKDKVISELQRVGITNYEIFKAIQPNEIDIYKWNSQFLNPVPQWFKNTGGDELKYKIGALGCMLSHIQIINKCIENNYTNVLILEDDTEFTDSYRTNFQDIMNNFKSQIEHLSFGLLYLAGNHNISKLEKKTNNIFKIDGTYTTGSYIINKTVMKYIIDNIQGYEREVDTYYANVIQKKYPCYCIMPHITKQRADYSDIVQKRVCYNL